MSLGRLSIDVVANTAQFKSSMDKASRKAQTTAQKMKAQFGAMKTAVATMSKVVGVVAVGALAVFAKKTIDLGDRIHKLNQRTSLSAEFLSEMKRAAELSGTTLETVAKSTQKLQKSIADAGRGLSTAKDAFSALNIDLNKFKELTPDQQFSVFADAISKVEDPAKKTQLAMDIMGRSGTEMLSVMNEGSEGIRKMREESRLAGETMGQEQVEGAAAANDAMRRLSGAFGGLTQQLVLKFAPALAMIADWLANKIPLAVDAVVRAFNFLKLSFQTVVSIMLSGVRKIIDAVQLIPGLGDKFIELEATIARIGAELDASMKATRVELAETKSVINENTAAYKEMGEVAGTSFEDVRAKLKYIFVDVERSAVKYKKKVEEVTDAVQTIRDEWDRVRDGVHDSWTNLFTDIFGGKGLNSISNFLNSIKDMFFSIIAEIAAKWAASKIFGIGKGGGFTGILGKMLGGTGGGGASGIMDVFSKGGTLSKVFGSGGSIATMASNAGAAISSGFASTVAAMGPAAPYVGAALVAGLALKKIFGGGRSHNEIFNDELQSQLKNGGDYVDVAAGGGIKTAGMFASGPMQKVKEFFDFVKAEMPGVKATLIDGVIRFQDVGVEAIDQVAKKFAGFVDDTSAGMTDWDRSAHSMYQNLRATGSDAISALIQMHTKMTGTTEKDLRQWLVAQNLTFEEFNKIFEDKVVDEPKQKFDDLITSMEARTTELNGILDGVDLGTAKGSISIPSFSGSYGMDDAGYDHLGDFANEGQVKVNKGSPNRDSLYTIGATKNETVSVTRGGDNDLTSAVRDLVRTLSRNGMVAHV